MRLIRGGGQHSFTDVWVGRRPDGPGADPEGKDLFLTEDSEIVGGVGGGPGGRVAGRA